MSWYTTDGPESNLVLWSKIKYLRNISNMPFSSVMSDDIMSGLNSKIDTLLQKNGFHSTQIDNNLNLAMSFLEKHYIDQDFLNSKLSKVLFFNEPCSLTIATGGNNLICIQALIAGYSMQEAHNIAAQGEELLDMHFDFAYNSEFGYLCPTPHNTGHGLELSCCLFLPAMSAKNNIEKLQQALSRYSFDFYPLIAGDKNHGDMYVLAYTPTRNVCEKDAVALFSNFSNNIKSLERAYQKELYSEHLNEILDKATKAMGCFIFSTKIDEFELLNLISNIRLALCLDLQNKLPKSIDSPKLNFLLAECLNASILFNNLGDLKNENECSTKRSTFLKDYFSSLKNI